MEKVRIGIIGLGRLGRKHAENIHSRIPNAELVAISSIVPAELAEVQQQMQPQQVTSDYRELLRNPKLDAVVIATNSQSHCQMIVEACEAGVKHIFTEKPMGMTLEEINKIKELMAQHPEVIFQVGYNRRFDRNYQVAQEKIAGGFIGKPILIKMVNRDPAAMAEFIVKFSPTSGGLVMDMLTHDYDLARWLVNSDAKTIFGVGGVYAYEGLAAVGDIDNCGILVQFKNGVMGWFETSRNCSYGYHVETEVFGTEGCIRVCTTPTKDRITYLDKNGVNQKCVEWFYEYWEPTFLAEMEHFVDCIIRKQSPLVSAADGYKTVAWAFAANEAIKGKKIVTLD